MLVFSTLTISDRGSIATSGITKVLQALLFQNTLVLSMAVTSKHWWQPLRPPYVVVGSNTIVASFTYDCSQNSKHDTISGPENKKEKKNKRLLVAVHFLQPRVAKSSIIVHVPGFELVDKFMQDHVGVRTLVIICSVIE